MNYAYDLAGSAPIIKKYKISETFATPGVYATNTAADGTGIVLGLETTVVAQLGVTTDTGTYTTKGVVGYDLTRLIIGSEGTLALIVEATLRLTPLAARRRKDSFRPR